MDSLNKHKNANLKYYDMGSTFLQMAKEARKIYVNRSTIGMVGLFYMAPRASRIPNRNLADSRQHLAVQDRELLVRPTLSPSKGYPGLRAVCPCGESLSPGHSFVPLAPN
jgi:hypothetical protein